MLKPSYIITDESLQRIVKALAKVHEEHPVDKNNLEDHIKHCNNCSFKKTVLGEDGTPTMFGELVGTLLENRLGAGRFLLLTLSNPGLWTAC